MMKYRFLFVFATILMFVATSCSQGEKNKPEYEVDHYNIIIAPDLSNRIDNNVHPKPVSDEDIIKSLFSNVDNILNYGHRSSDQKDKYSFAFTSNMIVSSLGFNQDLLSLDFSDFGNQRQRIDYIKSREEFDKNGLSENIESLLGECSDIYQKARTNQGGADLWSFMDSGIDATTVRPDLPPQDLGGYTVKSRHKNILILFTDGYIENGLVVKSGSGYSKNMTYDLPQSTINRFRQDYLKSNTNEMKKFFEDNQYGIIPVQNDYLKNFDILVMELYDRSLDKHGAAKVHPTDADIIKLFWSDWFKKSGVKNYELHTCVSSQRIAESILLEFIKR